MSKTKVTFKLDNLKQKIKAVTSELKDQKFGDHIAEQIVNKIRKEEYNFKTGRKHKPLKQSTIEMIECMNKGENVSTEDCKGCSMREGCPSWDDANKEGA